MQTSQVCIPITGGDAFDCTTEETLIIVAGLEVELGAGATLLFFL